MVQYTVIVEIDGVETHYMFENPYPPKNDPGAEMYALKEIVENTTRSHVQTSYGENTPYNIISAVYNIEGDFKPQNDFSIDLDYPYSDLP